MANSSSRSGSDRRGPAVVGIGANAYQVAELLDLLRLLSVDDLRDLCALVDRLNAARDMHTDRPAADRLN